MNITNFNPFTQTNITNTKPKTKSKPKPNLTPSIKKKLDIIFAKGFVIHYKTFSDHLLISYSKIYHYPVCQLRDRLLIPLYLFQI